MVSRAKTTVTTAAQRARRTNHPLVPPAGLRPGSREARRWTDAKLLSLIHLTLRLEQMRDATPPLPLHSELHAVQELRALLADLGLNDAPSDAAPNLQEYLRTHHAPSGDVS